MQHLGSRYAARVAFVGSGLALAAFPLFRPYGPEAGLAGAQDFASSAWVASHLVGAAGFVALALGLRAWGEAVEGRPAVSLRRSEAIAWLAVAFVMPFYGAETFGLQAIGAYVVENGDVAALEAVDGFRSGGVALSLFAVGLVLLGGVGVRLAVHLWKWGRSGRVAGLLVAAALVTYLPQYLGSPSLRMAHGVLLGVGLIVTGMALSTPPEQGQWGGTLRPGAGRVGEAVRTPN